MANSGEVRTGIRSRSHLQITPAALSPLTPCDDYFLLKANLSGQLRKGREEWGGTFFCSLRCVFVCESLIRTHISRDSGSGFTQGGLLMDPWLACVPSGDRSETSLSLLGPFEYQTPVWTQTAHQETRKGLIIRGNIYPASLCGWTCRIRMQESCVLNLHWLGHQSCLKTDSLDSL